MSAIQQAADRARHRNAVRRGDSGPQHLAWELSAHLNGLVHGIVEMYHGDIDPERLHGLQEELTIIIEDGRGIEEIHVRHRRELTKVRDDIHVITNSLVFGLGRESAVKELLRRIQHHTSRIGNEQYDFWARNRS